MNEFAARRRWVNASIAVGLSIVAAYVVALAGMAVAKGPTLFDVAFIYGVVASTVLCALIAIAALPLPRTSRTVATASGLGALAGIAPLAFVLFARLSTRACTGLNIFGLPWPEPGREIAHIVAATVWLGSTAALIVATTRPRYRWPAIALWGWSVLIAVPTVVLSALTTFGDPGPVCVGI